MPATSPAAPPSPPRTTDAHEIAAMHAAIMRSLEDDQVVDLMTIPLAGKTTIADHMVIASGRSTRQVASMAQKLAERIKGEFKRPARIEGLPTADWVLIDAGDVIVHIFRPEVRTFYNLEKMWAFGDTLNPTATADPVPAPPAQA